MKDLWVTTVEDLTNFLEKEIAEGRNPNTPEAWAELFKRLHEEEKVKHAGVVGDGVTQGYIAGSLRDEGFNARLLKRDGRA